MTDVPTKDGTIRFEEDAEDRDLERELHRQRMAVLQQREFARMRKLGAK